MGSRKVVGKIIAQLESVDFETNTATFKLSDKFWDTHTLYGGSKLSTIDCPNIVFNDKKLIN